jgi:RHS repeat-associated protein
VIECGPSRFPSLAAEPLSAASRGVAVPASSRRPALRSFSQGATSPRQTRVGGFSGCLSGRLSRRDRLQPITAPGCRACAYKTASGRAKWPNRDPIGEEGGINLYGFVDNNPIILTDPWGLDDDDDFVELPNVDENTRQSTVYQTGGGKNDPHKNLDAKLSAKEKYEKAKRKLEEAVKIRHKTKKDCDNENDLRKEVKHWKKKADEKGETHSRQQKGNRN